MAPPPMGFCRQEYGSGLPSPSPGDLLNSQIGPGSPALLADAVLSELQGSQGSVWNSYLLNGRGKEFWRPAGTSWELGMINLNVHFFLRVRVLCFA